MARRKNRGFKGKSWKKETAAGRKYRTASGADSTKAPKPYSREQVWVGGYTKRDGTKVEGHFRKGLKRPLF
jgi:hypothetical protein